MVLGRWLEDSLFRWDVRPDSSTIAISVSREAVRSLTLGGQSRLQLRGLLHPFLIWTTFWVGGQLRIFDTLLLSRVTFGKAVGFLVTILHYVMGLISRVCSAQIKDIFM